MDSLLHGRRAKVTRMYNVRLWRPSNGVANMASATVPGTIEAVALIFKLNNEMVVRSLAGVSNDDSWKRPASAGNPLGWLVGHVTVSRAQLLKTLGSGYDPGLGPLFNRGAALDAAASYPSLDVLEAAWRDTRGRMRDAFGGL